MAGEGELFGFQAGTRLADQDIAALANTQAVTRLHTAHAADLEAQTAERAKMMQVLASTPTADAAGDPLAQVTATLSNQAAALARAGMPLKAGDVAAKAAALTTHAQQTRAAAALEQKRVFDKQQAVLDDLAGLYSGVTDEASFNKAKMIFSARHPDVPLAEVFQKYDPQVVDTLLTGTKRGLEILKEQRRAADEESKVDNRESMIEFRNWRMKYLKGVEERRSRDSATRAKAAGSKVTDPGAPSRSETDQAALLVGQAYPNLPSSELTNAAFDVAARARQLRKTNAALDAGTALRQALEEAASDFEPLDKTFAGFKFGGRETRYKQGLRDKPADLPTNKGDLVINQTYNTAKGPAKWTGEKFKPVAPGKAAKAPVRSPPPDAGDAGDEEDDNE